MKLLLRYKTILGPRTVIVSAPDKEAAIAIMNAHLSKGSDDHVPEAWLLEDVLRVDMATHQRRLKAERAMKRMALIPQVDRVLPFKRSAVKGQGNQAEYKPDVSGFRTGPGPSEDQA